MRERDCGLKKARDKGMERKSQKERTRRMERAVEMKRRETEEQVPMKAAWSWRRLTPGSSSSVAVNIFVKVDPNESRVSLLS